MPSVNDLYYFEANTVTNVGSRVPTVVLIHGAGGNHLHWPHNIRRLSGCRVLAVDLPGHGKSGRVGEQSIEKYTRAIVEWARAIKLPKAVFVGHSMGGAIVQQLAVEYPEHVRGVGLIGTGMKLPVNSDLINKVSHSSTFPSAVDLIIKWSYAKETNRKLTDAVKNAMLEIRPAVLHGDYLACDAFNYVKQGKKIKQRALVIVGADDKMTPPRLSEAMVATINQAEYALIPHAGHMVIQEQSDVVAEKLSVFIRSLRSRY